MWIRRVQPRFRKGDELRNLKTQRYENMRGGVLKVKREIKVRREEKRKSMGKGKSEKRERRNGEKRIWGWREVSQEVEKRRAWKKGRVGKKRGEMGEKRIWGGGELER
jgi:hypothetical protein